MSKLNTLSLEGFLEFAKEANTRSTLAIEDGLKPVHRRILYHMASEKLFSNKEYNGSAEVVGSVLGRYHPHGDASVYDAAIRLSQNFKLRYPLIEVYGNNGSILEPDSYAAARYTKMRLTPIGEMMLLDIEKDTVPMVENYNGKYMEPVILPSMIPNILLNGGMGIGVGVSSSLVPHNLGEVVNAIIAYINNPRITTQELLEYIEGPDFPSGGVIIDSFSLPAIYESGKGTIKVRGKYKMLSQGGRTHIVITEIPYLVSLEKIIASIQTLVNEEEYNDIYDIQNNSGKSGVELRVILEKDANPNAVLKTLFERTGLESTIKINQTVMMSDGSFVTLNLRGLISQYIQHQHNIITNKYKWELQKALDRLDIVNGLIIAVQNIDEVVSIIKASSSPALAKMSLIKRFELNETQAQAILDMRLARLTSLEINKLMEEKKKLLEEITKFRKIIDSNSERENLIRIFLTELKRKFNDSRRTKVSETQIIEKGEHIFLAITKDNTITSIPRDQIPTLSRNKKGSVAFKMQVQDIVECNTKDSMYLLDKEGKLYNTTVNELLNGEVIFHAPIIKIFKPQEKEFIVFVTKSGIIKKTPNTKFKKSTQFTKVREDDELVTILFVNDSDYIMVLGKEGKCVNIPAHAIAAIGRSTFGSKGMSTEQVITATVAEKNDLILSVNTDGQAKLTELSEFGENVKGSSGNLITEDCNFIMSIGTSKHIALFGSDQRAAVLDIKEIAVKTKNATGAKIYPSKLDKIILL